MADPSLVHTVRPATVGRDPHPGLLLLHGLGSNELDLHVVATQLDPRIFAVSARAPLGLPWGGYAWYDLAEGPGRGGESIEAALERLRSFVAEIVERYPIDPTALYVGGFSQGAAMAGALALSYPVQVAGAIMISGFLPPPAPTHPYDAVGSAGKPFFQAHGTDDTVVLLDWARSTRDYLLAIPVDLTYREYSIAHSVSLEELADLSAWLEARLAAVQRPGG